MMPIFAMPAQARHSENNRASPCRRRTARGILQSVDGLKDAVTRGIRARNTDAKPFVRTKSIDTVSPRSIDRLRFLNKPVG
ncbi:hypothetical protein GAY31_24205 [Azospirillum brasilense]|nr:hypothetical protein [Azospirillum brasilense]